MDKVTEALNEEIISEIQSLSLMTDGCEAKASAIEDLCSLYGLRLEELKLETDIQIKTLNAEREAEEAKRKDEEAKQMTELDLKRKRKEDILNAAKEILKIALPIASYIMLFNKGLRFEETGTYTSTTVRNLLHMFKPVS